MSHYILPDLIDLLGYALDQIISVVEEALCKQKICELLEAPHGVIEGAHMNSVLREVLHPRLRLIHILGQSTDQFLGFLEDTNILPIEKQ